MTGDIIFILQPQQRVYGKIDFNLIGEHFNFNRENIDKRQIISSTGRSVIFFLGTKVNYWTKYLKNRIIFFSFKNSKG